VSEPAEAVDTGTTTDPDAAPPLEVDGARGEAPDTSEGGLRDAAASEARKLLDTVPDAPEPEELPLESASEVDEAPPEPEPEPDEAPEPEESAPRRREEKERGIAAQRRYAAPYNPNSASGRSSCAPIH
jgi:hypothetical protein